METDEDTIRRERAKISKEGWGAKLLAVQEPSGMWGGGMYSPKWISTNYTMILLRRLGLEAENKQAHKGCRLLLEKGFRQDGGINYAKSVQHSEACITGMVLSILTYFGYQDQRIESLVEYLFQQQMPDGGWNCQSYQGDTHSSFHTTICVLEGLREYEKRYPVHAQELIKSQERGREFLLQHKLYRSHRTGEIVDKRMMMFSFPPHWKYDVMRALDYFQECHAPRDARCTDAIELLKSKQKKDGFWRLQNRHSGKTFFELEQPGKPGRWNTLRALRILQWWDKGKTA